MHSTFVKRGGAAVPIWFADKTSWPALRAQFDDKARAFADASGSSRKPSGMSCFPMRRAVSPQCWSATTRRRRPGAIRFPPGGCPLYCRAGSIALPMPRRRRGLRRSLSRSAHTALAVTALSLAKRWASKFPTGSTAASFRASSRRCISRATSSIRPPTIWGRARSKRRPTISPRVTAPKSRTHVGEEVLAEHFPLIHAVGRAAEQAPRLIDLAWGDEAAPKVTLVGKGVCFDSGGLDLKSESTMRLMKKDMAGAASVLALAHMVMGRGLALRLRVLIPAVENAVSAKAFRPLDVYRSRKGLTVEIGNTDAEGRLVLADALALADEGRPDLLIDLGTLTGAARVALGPELPPFYTDDEALAAALSKHAAAENDPLWRMPLWRPYDSMLESKVADLNNASSTGFAGSIACALFLRRFVSKAKAWLHVDIYGWNPKTKPARPEGGECQAARALYALLCERYG